MPHELSLITTIVAGLGLALVLGFVATRLRLPALLGYLLAGVVLGPGTPGAVADMALASQLAEIGVMLLMFGVGLHLSLADLLAVRRIAVPGAIVQIATATALGGGLALLWGWSLGAALVFGLSLSVASTVVLLKALETRGALKTANGRIAVGWLVVEDLAMVLVLVLLPALGASASGDSTDTWRSLAWTIVSVLAFVTLMMLVGRRALPWLLWQVARTGSRELFTLCIVAAALGIAYLSAQLFGVSFALGAFFAGTVMRESEFSHRAAQDSLPFRDAFAVLFFVSVGMLFDPGVLVREPLAVLMVVATIVIGKSLAAAVLVSALGYPLSTALMVSASLAQIGEFSFILAALGTSLGVLPEEGRSLILAGALISIALNPFVFALVEPARKWMRSRSALALRLEQRDDPLAELPMTTERRYLSRQVVLVGYGRVGRHIAETLREHGIPFVVAEQNRELVEKLREQGIPAVSGDASDPAVLVQTHVAHAAVLVIAIPDTVGARRMVDTARTLNPRIRLIIRTHGEDEAQMFEREGIGRVFLADRELASGMARQVIDLLGSR